MKTKIIVAAIVSIVLILANTPLSNAAQGRLKVLRTAGINVVAIHNHIETESPRIVFLHYWGVGATTDLAKGLKAALDTQGK